MRRMVPILCLAQLVSAASGAESTTPAAVPAPTATEYAAMPRVQFNQRAAQLADPLFWVGDANADGTLDSDALAVTWGPGDASLRRYLKDGRFTPEFAAAYARIARPASCGGQSDAEQIRREAVVAEPEQGRPTLVLASFTEPRNVQLVGHVEKAARIIERLYAKESGVLQERWLRAPKASFVYAIRQRSRNGVSSSPIQ